MYQLTDYGKYIVSQYERAVPWLTTITIPFATYSSANQDTPSIPSDECVDPVLITEIGVDFLNALVKLTITDNNQYQWMQNNQLTPVHTIAGAATQVSPILPIPIEYFLSGKNKLFFQFRNASTSPETVNRFLTVRGLRLKSPIQKA